MVTLKYITFFQRHILSMMSNFFQRHTLSMMRFNNLNWNWPFKFIKTWFMNSRNTKRTSRKLMECKYNLSKNWYGDLMILRIRSRKRIWYIFLKKKVNTCIIEDNKSHISNWNKCSILSTRSHIFLCMWRQHMLLHQKYLIKVLLYIVFLLFLWKYLQYSFIYNRLFSFRM